MNLCTILNRVVVIRSRHGSSWKLYFLITPPFILFLITYSIISSLPPEILLLNSFNGTNATKVFQINNLQKSNGSRACSSSQQHRCDCNNTHPCSVLSPPRILFKTNPSPYHNWDLFDSDYKEMLEKLKIFVYPDVYTSNESSSPFAHIFLPHSNPLDPKIGNYYSEHAFKLALLRSSLVTERADEAHFFFIPFSINAMRNHPLLHSESNISSFVANYVVRISSEFRFWNASGGADHFFVCCHSVGREAASKHFGVRNNAIQITCSSSYFQRLYNAHKDIALPQVWPRQDDQALSPPTMRTKLVFFAGRMQNSDVRQELLTLWGNDTSFNIFSQHSQPYEEGFRRSKYCLHIKGYEVNTARVVDAIHYGCIPVVISNYYDLPFASILDWTKFSIIVHQRDIALLKNILLSVSDEMYLNLYHNLLRVRKHFRWHIVPQNYDAFYMTAYQLWLRRGLHRVVE